MNDFGCAFEYFNKCRENLVPYNIIIIIILVVFTNKHEDKIYLYSQAQPSKTFAIGRRIFFTLIFHNLNFLIYRWTTKVRVSLPHIMIYIFIYIMCPRMVTAARSKNFSALSIFKRTVKIITTTMIYKYERKFMYSLAWRISFI